MILAVDVHYDDPQACAAGVLFDDWTDAEPCETLTTRVGKTAPYRPGAFYMRELPVLLKLLHPMLLIHKPEAIVIDGYVTLGEDARPGLGAHLYDALEEEIPVIGVAKTLFAGTPEAAGVLRGGSSRPLFVTTIGTEAEDAKKAVRHMHGPHRIPTLLQQVDRLCRDGLTGRA